MRIFLIASGVPFRRHDQPGVTAVHLVSYALLKSLMDADHHVALQLIFNPFRTAGMLTSLEQDALDHLRGLGVEVLAPYYPRDYRAVRPSTNHLKRWYRAILRAVPMARIKRFYPAIMLRDAVCARARSYQAQVILTFWSPEGVAATHGLQEIPRIAYQGDVDFAALAVRLQDWRLFSSDGNNRLARLWRRPKLLAQHLQLAQFKRVHFQLMRPVRVIANVTASNAQVYRAQGHPRAIYIPNTWERSDDGQEGNGTRRSLTADGTRPINIIGHLGYLNRTGSTYGLRFLLEDVAPRLRHVMEGRPYQIHIIGGGEAAPSLKRLLIQEGVIVHGYVEDLDHALRSSDVFLLLNNVGGYRVAYTRHLVAWSMGLCLVVHRNSQEAIPEIQHMENALVGSTADDIANLVALATTNAEVNQRIRAGGKATYEQYFRPSVIAKALCEEMSRMVEQPI